MHKTEYFAKANVNFQHGVHRPGKVVAELG